MFHYYPSYMYTRCLVPLTMVITSTFYFEQQNAAVEPSTEKVQSQMPPFCWCKTPFSWYTCTFFSTIELFSTSYFFPFILFVSFSLFVKNIFVFDHVTLRLLAIIFIYYLIYLTSYRLIFIFSIRISSRHTNYRHHGINHRQGLIPCDLYNFNILFGNSRH